MRLVMIGGGGFRTPLVLRALLSDPSERRVEEIVLVDVEEHRLRVIESVASGLQAAHPHPLRIRTTTNVREALPGADFVFVAIRVGGLAARVADERIALGEGLIGQETTGAGGVAYGLRTVPVMTDMAALIAEMAPRAWVINFTNPAGLVTQAMRSVLGERVVGICDSPVGLVKRVARGTGVRWQDATIDYAGLNHLGWLHHLEVGGHDVLSDFLADDAAVAASEEGALFGAAALRAQGVVPNEYLYYYDHTKDALTALRAGPTRGEVLTAQQRAFYASTPTDDPLTALAAWESARHERNASYLAELRGSSERHEEDIDSGGYEGVALALMRAIAHDEPAQLILNLPAPGAIAGLPDAAVVEVPTKVSAAGPVPLPVTSPTGPRLELVHRVKTVEELVLEACATGDRSLAVAAFAVHPLVPDEDTGARLLAAYESAIPSLARVFAR